MIEIRRILCPVDGSAASRGALAHAVTLAGWYESRLTVLHVWDPPYFPQPPVLAAEADHPVFSPEDGSVHDAEVRINEWLADARRLGIECEPVIESSHHPAERILHLAGTMRSNLLVLGTHGRTGFERLVLGSVAEKVLRKVRCPVLTVPPPAAFKATRLPFKRLLCPVDFSDASLAAVQYALSIAKESDAHITLLHSIEWPSDDDVFAALKFADPNFKGELEEQVVDRLESLVSTEDRTWCDPASRVTDGKAHQRIVEFAETDETDLIVMGVHGRTPLDTMLFGSTTTQTVRHAPCPVLTIKW